MTPTDKHLTALRVAIAEHMQNIPIGFSIKSLGGWISHIPNYPGSLEAMHEAEEVIFKAQAAWRDYESAIRDITLRDGRDGGGLYERLIRATAFQRAEAFVAACGLTERVKELEKTL